MTKFNTSKGTDWDGLPTIQDKLSTNKMQLNNQKSKLKEFDGLLMDVRKEYETTLYNIKILENESKELEELIHKVNKEREEKEKTEDESLLEDILKDLTSPRDDGEYVIRISGSPEDQVKALQQLDNLIKELINDSK